MFLALNWPTDSTGKPAARITDSGPGLAPAWTLWHASSSIFQTDGAPPQACSAPPAARKLVLRRDLSKPVSHGLRPFSSQAIANADHRQKRFLGVMSAVGELNAGNLGSDIKQAFSGPLIDQNNEFVFYEIMIDPNEVNYLCANRLYNINGQVAFSKAGGKVAMPWGVDSQDGSGSFELKLAWRILKPLGHCRRPLSYDAGGGDGPGRQPARRSNGRSPSAWSGCISATRPPRRRSGSGRPSSKSTISTSIRSPTRI